MSQICPAPSFFESPAEFAAFLHIFSIIDIPMNLLCLYLVIYQTPAYMSNVKKTLLNLQIWSTISDLALGPLVLPYTFFPEIAFWPMGLLTSWGGVNPAIQAYFTMVFISEVGAGVILMFVNRHFHVVKSGAFRIPNKICWRLVILVNVVMPFFLILGGFTDIPAQENIKEQLIQQQPCPSIGLITLPIYMITRNATKCALLIGFLLFFYVFELCFLVPHTIYHLHLKLKDVSISNRTRIIEKRFYYSTFVQSLIPMAVIVVPGSCSASRMYYSNYSQSLNNIVTIIIGCHGFIGSIAIIVAYKEYRLFIRRWIFKDGSDGNLNKKPSMNVSFRHAF